MTRSSSVIATPHPKGERPPIRFLSVCSGIEAASQALIPLGGFKCIGVAEIEPHPCHVLAHRFGASRPINMPSPEDATSPKERAARAAAIKAVSKLPVQGDIPNYGDMSRFQEWPDADVDALCGGTPCQSFSVAGLRAGLADPRGNLMLTFGAIAARLRPRWLLWENVPGVLSSDGGRDFASFLGLITGRSIVPPPEGWQNSGIVPGIADAYGVAWRVLDAQHVRTRSKRRAVPQRRRRVFVVGYLGDWTRAAAVLFDAESLRRDPAPRREAGKGIARGFECGPQGGGFTDLAPTLDARCKDGPIRNQIGAGVITSNSGEVGYCLTASAQQSLDAETETLVAVAHTLLGKPNDSRAADLDTYVAHALRGEGFDASEDGTGRGTPLVAVNAYRTAGDGAVYDEGNVTAPLTTATDPSASIIAIQERAVAENPNSGPGGAVSSTEGAAYTLEARNTVQAVAFDAKGTQVQTDDSGAAPTLRAMTHADSKQNGGGQLAVAYSIQAGAVRENPASGPDGVGVQEGHAYTLEARQEVQAVAYGITTAMTPKFGEDGTGRGTPVIPIDMRQASRGATMTNNRAEGSSGGAPGTGIGKEGDPSPTISTNHPPAIAIQDHPWAVRRLTPRECERLMGMEDDITNVPWRGKDFSPDGNRYKEIGNSWALNCIEWIGERMLIVDAWE